jgi:NAD(P)-dependent dehydrogenase (short-subunit alcohol dehydrogenase family)
MKTESVLITGTTSGLGHALLKHYTDAGARVIAVNRRRVHELGAAFPQVRFECVDVRDASGVDHLLQELQKANQLPDCFLLNAGINEVDNDESFDIDTYRAVMETNLYGVLHFVAPLTKIPAGGKRRHIIAVSSMANYVGNPYGLGYSTSKRALTSCFDAWSQMYRGTDLVFQQVMLGPVRSSIKTMDDRMSPWVGRTREIFSGNLEETVRAIARFAETKKKRLFTPRRAVPLYLAMKLTAPLLPGLLQGKATLDGAARRKPQAGG